MLTLSTMKMYYDLITFFLFCVFSFLFIFKRFSSIYHPIGRSHIVLNCLILRVVVVSEVILPVSKYESLLL